ncbi:hypothetical protein [Gramella sp. KN1008]|uniref:hypothetical protein n=1 Tax=Gramella sp. KN1008 TaxID=2529298 RepID=UPI00103FF063|nr:hypothetical protein [Gramella sp. KN1008]TBW28044.1 hypothetical protein EZJ28_09960 [Gramella sp. KN1008]
MINNIKSLLILATLVITISCSKEALTPEVNFNVDNANPQVGETITFTVSGDAETYVVYTGDTSHEFAKSHLVLTEGMDVDQELVVLANDSLPAIREYLEGPVNNYNADANANGEISLDNVMSNIANLVGKEYTNKQTAAYEMWEFASGLEGQLFRDLVDLYFEDNSTLLAPEGGFSTGFAVNRYEKTFKYTYSTPGTYTATLIATNVGGKEYSGSGYQDDRTSSGDEYDLNRKIKELVITVQPD